MKEVQNAFSFSTSRLTPPQVILDNYYILMRYLSSLISSVVCSSVCWPLSVHAGTDTLSCDVDSSSSSAASLRNAAIVFLKPHANTPAAQALVRDTLRQHGIDILSEHSIDAETIEKKKLIDNHYYAIGKEMYTFQSLRQALKESRQSSRPFFY